MLGTRQVFKKYETHVRKYYERLSKKKYVQSKKGKEHKKIDDSKYHSRMKQDSEYLKKRRDYMTEYNNTPERKVEHCKVQKVHRSKPEVKKKNAEYSKKRNMIPKVKKRDKELSKIWKKNNPDKLLVISKRHLEKLGLPFKLPSRQYGMALESWAKSVRKLLGEKCVICDSTNRVNIHHLFHKALYPLLSLNINNGLPLCHIHHNEAHEKMLIMRGI